MNIVVPIMPRNVEEVALLDRERLADADLIEWRADYLPKEDILTVAPAVFEACVGKEVIFTLRTSLEGGQIVLSDEEYLYLLKEIAALYQPDYIDFEYYSRRGVFEELLDFPNLVLSYHNYKETPEDFMEIMSELTSLSPAVVKIAVMPQSEQDVLDILNYTRGFKTLHAEQSYATVAMGNLGKLSRLAGGLTGSCWSFAYLDEPTSPGQLPLSQLKTIRDLLYREEETL